MGFARALLKSVCYKTSEYQAKLDVANVEFIQLSASRELKGCPPAAR